MSYYSESGPPMRSLTIDETIGKKISVPRILESIHQDKQGQLLEHLHLETITDLACLQHLVKSLTRLRVSVSPIHADHNLISKFKHLKCLHVKVESKISQLGDNFELGVDNLLDGVLSLANLETLILESFLGGLNKFANSLADGHHFSKLEKLAFRLLMDVSGGDVYKVANILPQLSYFEIDDSFDILDEVPDIIENVSVKFKTIYFTSLPQLKI